MLSSTVEQFSVIDCTQRCGFLYRFQLQFLVYMNIYNTENKIRETGDKMI